MLNGAGDGCQLHGEIHVRRALGGVDELERFTRIQAPVLAIAGAASPPWAASMAVTLAGALPRASTHRARTRPTDLITEI